jgi:hypothetical protein
MDETRAEQFTGRVLTDTAAAATVVMAALGDRLGLFRQLAQAGPATSGELASRAGLSERYVREWLAGMRAAGYLEFDPAQDRFSLPAEHVPTLASEPGPAFFGGVHQELIGAIQRYDQVAAAFRDGAAWHPKACTPMSGPAPAGSPPSGTRTYSSSSGCRWSQAPRPSCQPAPGWPMWAAAPGRR